MWQHQFSQAPETNGTIAAPGHFPFKSSTKKCFIKTFRKTPLEKYYVKLSFQNLSCMLQPVA